MKAVGQDAVGVERQLSAHFTQILLNLGRFLLLVLLDITAIHFGDVIADANLFRIRHAREMHRHARQFLFGIRNQIQHGGRTCLDVHLAPLAPHHGGHAQHDDSRK